MGFGKWLVGGLCAVGAVIAAPVVLPIAAAAGAAAVAGAAVAGTVVAGGVAAAGTAIAGTAVGGAVVGATGTALGAVGGVVGSAAGAVGLTSVAAAAGTSATAVGAITTVGVVGVGSGIHGAVKMKEASDTMQSVELRHKKNKARFKRQSKITSTDMDNLGKKELEILGSFEKFTTVFEKIHSKPQFKTYNKDGVNIPRYNGEELKQVSVGAGILLGGIGGAAIGTAGGFAAAGATTAAVMALGTASTGTVIASLSGVAATNATLAAIGGGAIAAGGGGMVLGTAILGAATVGVGLLVGGIIFNITGSSLSDKADEAREQMEKAEYEIDKICAYLIDLSSVAVKFDKAISKVNNVYTEHLNKLTNIVEIDKKTDWLTFTEEEKLITENTVLLVNLLFNMGKVQLVLVSKNETKPNRVNRKVVDKSILDSETFIEVRNLA